MIQRIHIRAVIYPIKWHDPRSLRLNIGLTQTYTADYLNKDIVAAAILFTALNVTDVMLVNRYVLKWMHSSPTVHNADAGTGIIL